MVKEFRAFVMRGNVIDMAVGIVIGAAFGKIVNSLVSDIIMPPIGILLGKVDFSALSLTLQQKTATTAAVTINYGAFINTIINFLILAFAIFIVIKRVNALMPKKEEAVTTKECPFCLSNIPLKATKCSHCTSPIK